MGTINYKTSDFITLGVNVDNYEDYTTEDGDRIEGSRHEIIDDLRRYTENLFEKSGLNNNSAYTVKIESGYYEGFYICITDEYLYFDDEEDRKEGAAELEKVFDFLNSAADLGLSVCFPSWCTTYLDYTEGKEAIAAAKIEAMKANSSKPDYEGFKNSDEYKKTWGVNA